VIQWLVFPRSKRPSPAMRAVVEVFRKHEAAIDSVTMTESSNAVLAIVAADLRASGFTVESGKQREDKIAVPVLFGLNGKVEKSFLADAFHLGEGVVLEVEAGRGVDNNQFLKDLFQACMMQDARHLVICVRNVYRKADDFKKVCTFFDTLYASHRIQLPLESVMILGY